MYCVVGVDIGIGIGIGIVLLCTRAVWCCCAAAVFVACALQVTVVLKHLFTPDEAAEGGSSFATEVETDVTAECKKLGTIEKVSEHL